MRFSIVRENLKAAKTVIRAAFRDASEAQLAELLLAAREGTMPYKDSSCCLATRLYGFTVRLRMRGPVFARYMEVERAYLHLADTRLETERQRVVVSILKAELARRNHRFSSARRASAYFAAAEDEAWFLLSLSGQRTNRAQTDARPEQMSFDPEAINFF